LKNKRTNLRIEILCLGLPVDEPVYFPTFIPSLEGKKWTKFSGGLHHTLGLTADGIKTPLIISYSIFYHFR
jgi:hypothetical protein